MPEGILGVQHAVFDDHVLDVLEGVLAFEVHFVEVNMIGAHHEIFAFHVCILHLHPACGPSEFRGQNVTSADFDVTAFPDGFDAVELRIPDLGVFCVPQGGAAERCEFTAGDGQIVVVPEGIAKVEETVLDGDVPAFFEGTFSVCRSVELAVSDQQIPGAIERAFLVEGFVFHKFHSGSSSFPDIADDAAALGLLSG